MSKQRFEKDFQLPLLRKLDKEARKAVQRQRGQLLILADTKDLRKVIELVVPGIEIKEADLLAALQAGQKHAKKLQESFKSRNKRRFNAVVAKLPSIGLPYTLNEDMFIVTSFSKSVSVVKVSMLKVLEDRKVLSNAQSKDVSSNLHKGHGAEGTAVSQVQIASSVSGLDDSTKKLLLHNLASSAFKGDISSIEYREISRLITKSSQIVTKAGKLTADYVSVISFQSGKENIADSKEEKALKTAYRSFLKGITPELLNMEGSSSLKQKANKVVIAKFKTSNKNVKVSSKALSHKLSTKTSVTTKPKLKKGKAVITQPSSPRKSKRKTQASPAGSMLEMIGMINKELPNTVRRNMQEPALVNRTGRFAESTRVTDITQTPKGLPSIGYTYQRDPYQVFEEGSSGAWSNGQRDPRKLIDKSIREIAVKMAIGRFYTRRV
jgi:hypothetical protein